MRHRSRLRKENQDSENAIPALQNQGWGILRVRGSVGCCFSSGAGFEAALFPEFFPVPDAVGGGQRKTQLMRQHQHLTAVVSFVREHVDEHGWSGGPGRRPAVAVEFCNACWVGRQGVREHAGTAFAAFGEGGPHLFLCCAGAIEILGKFQVGRRQTQPFTPNVVDVSEDGGNGAYVAAGKFCAPSMSIEIGEDELIHAFVGGPDFEEQLAMAGVGLWGAAGHGGVVCNLSDEGKIEKYKLEIPETGKQSPKVKSENPSFPSRPIKRA